MFKHTVRTLSLVMALVLLLTVGGVWATWMYASPPEPQSMDIPVKIANFHYADIYITKITPQESGLTKTNHTTVQAGTTGNASFQVTFYNGSNVPYYYKDAQIIDNGSANFEVSDIPEENCVASKTYETFTVTFSGSTDAEIFFHFVVDKESIGEVVASTAVDRFREILNNATDYKFLTDAMDDRAGWFNPGSDVTYIGNVAGSGTGDSSTINTLFGNEFMSMDLDGDGKTEPITMMIKRENLDSNSGTGDSYSYSSGWGGNMTTVQGAEMTLYITSETLTSQKTVVVYAVAFTKYSSETEWVELVPLTKGTATTNNYNGYGSPANSFNTDTWKSDGGQTLRQIIAAQN